MEQSDKLRHFPELDPATSYPNKRLRDEIESQVQVYLNSGGTIEQIDHTANNAFNRPLKRTRKQQTEWLRRTGSKW